MKSATKQQHRSGQKVGFVLGLPKFNLESVILHEISEQYTNLDVMCLEWYFAKICALCVDQKSKMDVITGHILKIVPYIKHKKCRKKTWNLFNWTQTAHDDALQNGTSRWQPLQDKYSTGPYGKNIFIILIGNLLTSMSLHGPFTKM